MFKEEFTFILSIIGIIFSVIFAILITCHYNNSITNLPSVDETMSYIAAFLLLFNSVKLLLKINENEN